MGSFEELSVKTTKALRRKIKTEVKKKVIIMCFCVNVQIFMVAGLWEN